MYRKTCSSTYLKIRPVSPAIKDPTAQQTTAVRLRHLAEPIANTGQRPHSIPRPFKGWDVGKFGKPKTRAQDGPKVESSRGIEEDMFIHWCRKLMRRRLT